MSHECHQTFEDQRNEASEGQEISVREYSDPVEDSIQPRRNSSGSSSSDNTQLDPRILLLIKVRITNGALFDSVKLLEVWRHFIA